MQEVVAVDYGPWLRGTRGQASRAWKREQQDDNDQRNDAPHGPIVTRAPTNQYRDYRILYCIVNDFVQALFDHRDQSTLEFVCVSAAASRGTAFGKPS